MGGGASKKAAKKNAAGNPAGAGAADASLTPSLRRRRRLLVGSEGPRSFERVPLKKQFQEKPDDDDDPVFERRDDAELGEIQRRANQMQDADGYLKEHAIELLDMRLGTKSVLSQRLFSIGKVQTFVAAPVDSVDAVGGGVPVPIKRDWTRLTCYELLALFSMLRGGTDEEIVELLFCVFDVDGDDRVSLQDLELVIEPFLEMSGALEGMEKQDVEGYNKLVGKARTGAIKEIAQSAIKQYGGPASSDPEANAPSTELPAPADATSTDVAAVPPPADSAGGVSDQPNPLGPSPTGGSSEAGEKDSVGNASTDAVGGQEAAAAAAPAPAKKKRGFSLCGGKKPSDDASASEDEKKKPKAEPKAKAPAAAAPKPKPAAKKKGGKPEPSTLGFLQFHRWLHASGFLPEGIAGAAPPPPSPPVQAAVVSAAAAPVPAASGGSGYSSGRGINIGGGGEATPLLSAGAAPLVVGARPGHDDHSDDSGD